jgi:hypothetical protein
MMAAGKVIVCDAWLLVHHVFHGQEVAALCVRQWTARWERGTIMSTFEKKGSFV